MIPVATSGTSFKGCVAYHAHDKRLEGEAVRETRARVAWTHTRNLPTDDVDKAWRVMAFTAQHQKEIKAAAGEPLNGPRCRKPVYSLVLAYDPSQTPSKDEMLRAAEGALKALRMETRQAIIFCHTDEPQPHIHIVVNRVCHLTGRAADIKRDWIKLSKWAERYERETGRVFCDLRVNHNARRANGEYVKNDNLSRKEYEIVRLYMRKTPEQIRAERSLQQASDRADHQLRQSRARHIFDVDLARLYGEARKSVARQISAIEGRRDLKGLFASIVRFKRRLTGEIARQERDIANLRKTLANLDFRIFEQRAVFERKLAAEAVRLENRHHTERERDERLIAHARGRSERERAGLKARMNFKVRTDRDPRHVPKTEDKQKLRTDLPAAARDQGPGLLDRLVRSLGGPAEARSREQSLGSDRANSEPEREKRWTRKEGRGANRTEGRPRPRRRER